MGKLFRFIFGSNKEEYNEMEYYYDNDDISENNNNIMTYREPNTIYANKCFDGGDAQKEDDYKSNKVSGIY